MSTTAKVLVVLLASLLSRPTFLAAQIRDVRVSLLYDNAAIRGDLIPYWGLTRLVQCDERTILFDAEAKPAVLRHNMAALGVDQSRIEAIAISHEHSDLLSRISAFSRKSITLVYLPRDARIYEMTSEALRNAAAQIVVVSELTGIAPFIRISKPLGGFRFEQVLVIDTWNGLVVIVGCAHPGIVAMVNASPISRRAAWRRHAPVAVREKPHYKPSGQPFGATSSMEAWEPPSEFPQPAAIRALS
jgi:7,8-dihydropterin-6-yl-methyl-4-(beta-D-ribofuranosyl)aminobenzene 5'-phosphate synthase